jgi:hypothetical protein
MFQFPIDRNTGADQGGRVVYGMNYLRPLEHFGSELESHLRHGCL